ncbi:hypothetical protein B0J14DRAFT_534758 [Halenospora varia]|nr:hypothetical protein B0J14DRAFT_534758 [Halenospora varia]
MRTTTLTTSFFLLPVSISALQIPSIFAPFFSVQDIPLTSSTNETIIPVPELLKRDGNCPVNYNACTQANFAGACCPQNAICTTDRANNVACCPVGATCTGTLTRATGTTTTTGIGGVIATITNAASVVPNAFFPFPYIGTSYPNSAACNSAFLACQSNYAACTQDLQGGSGGFAVTIVAPGGGVTVNASPTVQNLGASSAQGICSSLSTVACFNLQSSNCAQFGTGTATGGGSFVTGTGTKNAAGARQTGMGCMVMVAGVGLGIAGQII